MSNYSYYGQQVLFNNFQIVLFTGSNQNVKAYIPLRLSSISAYSSGLWIVPSWRCRTVLGLICTGSQLQTGSITKVTFEIGEVNADGSFSGSSYGVVYPNWSVSGSGTGSVETDLPIYCIALPTVSVISSGGQSGALYDFSALMMRISIYGGVTGENTPATLKLYHRRGLPDTYISPQYMGS